MRNHPCPFFYLVNLEEEKDGQQEGAETSEYKENKNLLLWILPSKSRKAEYCLDGEKELDSLLSYLWRNVTWRHSRRHQDNL